MVRDRLTAERFHEELVSAFLGAEYLVSCVMRGGDPSDDAEHFYTLRATVDALAAELDLLLLFQGERQRLATAAGDSPILIDSRGVHQPSYHDAAFALVDDFLNEFMLPDLDETGVVRRWWIFPEMIATEDFRNAVKPWKERFQGVLSEYQANLRLEAVQILLASRQAAAVAVQFSTNNTTNTNRTKKNQQPSTRNIDVRDLWDKLKGDDRPRLEIAREFTGETVGEDSKAKSLLAEINRRVRRGMLS